MNKLMNKLGKLNWLKFPWFYHFLTSIVLIILLLIINYTANFSLVGLLHLVFITGISLVVSDILCHRPKRREFIRTNNVPKKVAIFASFYLLGFTAVTTSIIDIILNHVHHQHGSSFIMPTTALVIYLIFVGLNLLMGVFSFLEYKFNFCIACKFANTINKLQNKRKK